MMKGFRQLTFSVKVPPQRYGQVLAAFTRNVFGQVSSEQDTGAKNFATETASAFLDPPEQAPSDSQ